MNIHSSLILVFFQYKWLNLNMAEILLTGHLVINNHIITLEYINT